MNSRSTALRRFSRLAAATLAGVVVLTLSSVVPASAAGSSVTGQGSGRCLDVVAGRTDPGTRVNIYDCNGAVNQQWTLTAAGELRVYDDARCLDVKGRDTTSPAVAQITTCNGGSNQKWTVKANGSIVGVQSGLCLDVDAARTANSSLVDLWTCNGQDNQKWKVAGAATGSDTAIPSTPGNPRVFDLRCNSVTFSWDAATDDVGVTAYDVYHDGQLTKTVSGDVLSTSLTVQPGVRWGLYVNARDGAGKVSQPSATVTITPPQCVADTTAPSTPQGLTASASGTTVSLSWSASTDDTGVTAYDVYRGDTRVGSPAVTSFRDSGLNANTTYTYAIVARDAQGNSSPRSGTASTTTGSACTGAVCSVAQVATDTDIPWGVLTMPDGSVLYSRRDAYDIVRLDPGTGRKVTVGTVPNVASTDGEGGLLGLVLSPTFETDHWLYVMHTSPADNRVVRMRLNGDTLETGSVQVLVSGILRAKFHDGGRLRFGPDGKLYISTGDAETAASAQDTTRLNGKVLRINPDGSIPTDNPFGNAVWSYGHRNPQGLAFDSRGRLWEQEFGNTVMDETNLIVKGGNYGWPACEGTSGTCGTAGYVAPKKTYATADGSCSGIAIVKDALYVACGRGQRMYRHVISGDSLVDQQQYYVGTYGRLRTVESAPGNGLWLTTTNNGDKDSIANNSDNKILRVQLGG